MTKEEIINEIKPILSELDYGEDAVSYLTQNDVKWLNENIKALEQEPKQVDLEGDGYADGELVYDYGKCPSCGWQFEYGEKDWEEPYCCHCGQKLKWFEESEDKE